MKTLTSKYTFIASFFALLFSLQVNTSFAKEDEVYTGFWGNKAVSGYDTVAYFTEGKPVKGSKKFKYKYKGAEWFFSSAKNLELFKNTPEKYAPQYGGYCAWAVSQGHTASADPKQWNIQDGKLYLNYDASVQKDWLKDKQNFINLADKNWPSVLK
ncbi:YHS domain protein [Endozoicomonas sp. OPT23]|uniref:YHS domain-containing (seleno)protein n=1 Tax=Endozoicomonas sp. OPT23 TaxID=2072845 RepID=UPI00129AB59C|nr:YHS domain-containing (seleno)protein [Endozoicomonas sp. OPT23]MRI31946.1 YHS domain protein [Endozoicomonas sp. OPT23]